MVSETKVRLFPGGPEFPSEFLDFVQEGRVVFFCGAGLSAGTGLPTFSGLVRELDEILNPDSANRFGKEREDYDRMLDELEGQFQGGRKRMREHVRDILSKPPRAPRCAMSPGDVLANHRSILKLAAVPDGGFRLVTTNFDDRFALANDGAIQSKDWPELPSLKNGQWASLVHLHGRIRDNVGLGDLVLTASDFGKAYLPPDPRAANFIVDLLRQWPVAFVGYGLNDPPMNYLVRAVHDERNSSEKFQPSFALVGCKAGEEGNRRREWENKRVVPILYDDADGHKSLREVLDNLARLKDEPGYRAELAIRGVDGDPGDENGDNGRRVVWALRDSVAAGDFSENKKPLSAADEKRFIHWLYAIRKSGLFRVNSAAVDDSTVDPLFSLTHAQLSPAGAEVARWIARHVHQPALLWWLVRESVSLHPRMLHWLSHYVGNGASEENTIPNVLAEKWQLFIQEQAVPPPSRTLLPAWAWTGRDHFGVTDLVVSNLERHLLAALRPRLQIEQGFSQFPQEYWVSVGIDCDMRRSDMAEEMEEWIKESDFAVKHAETLSSHLEDTLSLAEKLSVQMWEPFCFHPHGGEYYGRAHWVFLARMVRDAVPEIIKEGDIARLKNLVSRWKLGKHALLHRLTLHSIAETANLSVNQRISADWGAEILMRFPNVLWSPESKSESLRFLRKAGAHITPPVRAELERAIRKGPPRKTHVPEEIFPKFAQRQMATRLAKLEVGLRPSGAMLSPESGLMLANARKAEPAIKFECEREVVLEMSGFRPMPVERINDAPKWAEMTADECANHIKSAQRLSLDSLVNDHPGKAVEVFEGLALQKFRKRDKWKLFLGSFRWDKDVPDEFALRLTRLLETMPDELALPLAPDCARLLHVIARTLSFPEMEKAWRKVWDIRPLLADAPDNNVSQESAIDHAHGMLAEAVLIRFGREKDPEKLLDLLAEILASEEPSHKHGKVVIGGALSFLFRQHPEWARMHLLPFFSPKSPMSREMWDAFLHNPEISADLLAELKPGLAHFLQCVDDFQEGRSVNLVAMFFIGARKCPDIFPLDERRQMVGGMSPKGIQHLCRHITANELQDNDGVDRAKAWRERIFPFLREVWPEGRWPDGDASDISRVLAEVIMWTGNAFPEAAKWAHPFLSPIAGGMRYPRHPVMAFTYSRKKQMENILSDFPRECLLFLDRVVPEEFDRQRELRDILKIIRDAAPELEKRPEFKRLRTIASGG